MKFLVACLDDDFTTRVLASRSKSFTSIKDAIGYGTSIAHERDPRVVPVASDAQHAAEFIFDHVVERHPHFVVSGDHAELKEALRYEIHDDGMVAVFSPGNEIASAFMEGDFDDFINELERLVTGGRS